MFKQKDLQISRMKEEIKQLNENIRRAPRFKTSMGEVNNINFQIPNTQLNSANRRQRRAFQSVRIDETHNEHPKQQLHQIEDVNNIIKEVDNDNENEIETNFQDNSESCNDEYGIKPKIFESDTNKEVSNKYSSDLDNDKVVLSELIEEVVKYKLDKEKMENELQELYQEISSLKNKEQELNDALSKTKEEQIENEKKLNDTISQLQNEIQNKTKEINNVVSQNQEKIEIEKSLNDTINQLKKDSQKKEKELNDTLSQVKEEISNKEQTYKNTIFQLTNDMQTKEKELNTFSTVIFPSA